MRCKYLVLGIFVLVSAQQWAQIQPAAESQPEKIASFEMRWAQPTQEQILTRAKAAIEAITGETLKQMPSLVAPLSRTSPQRIALRVTDAPEFDVTFFRNYDELRLVNRELSVSAPPHRDMTQDEALKIARTFFGELAKRKLVDERQFSWEKADVASTWIGGAPVGEEKGEKKRIEYRITLRRVINGIEVANAGVRIAVHTTGAISGLRIGGVSVLSRIGKDGVEEPLGKGQWLRQEANIREAEARFNREIQADNARPKVAWSRLMYVMPEGKVAAVVQPLYVVSYSLQFPSDDGKIVVSRRKTIGYSLVSTKLPAIDLTPPMRPPQVDRIKKSVPKTAVVQ